jgi:hypothetical protein
MRSKPTKIRRRQRSAVKTLLAGNASVRAAQPKRSLQKAKKVKQPQFASSPTLPTEMTALMSATLHYPMRVMACRTPFQIWLEQARLMHAWFIAGQTMTFARPWVPPLPSPLTWTASLKRYQA